MAEFNLGTYEGRQAARDAGNWVGEGAGGQIVMEGGHPGGQAGTAAAPQQAASPYGDLGAITRGFAASSGMSQKQLDEQIREFDKDLDFKIQQWREQGLPELAIKQRAQDLEEAKFKDFTAQATRQQDWVEKIGERQAALAEKTQADANAIAQGQLGVQQGQLGVSQGTLGLNTLQAAAGLSGPADWIRAANFTRGVQGSNLPGFINQLLSGQSTAVLGGPQPGMQQSPALTMGSLAARMGAPQPGQPGQPGEMQLYAQGQAQGQMTPEQQRMQQMQQMQAQMPGQGQFAVQPGTQMEQVPGAGAGGTEYQKYLNAQGAQGAAQQGEVQAQVMPGGGAAPVPGGAYESGLRSRVQGYLGNMGYQPDQLNNNTDAASQKLKQVYAQGGQALGPQQLEGLSPSEMQMFTGGGEALGQDTAGFLEQYKRSRIGQSSSAMGSAY